MTTVERRDDDEGGPSTTTEKESKPRRSVRFHKKVKTRTVPTHRTLSDSERSSVWYHKKDFKKMKRSYLEESNRLGSSTLYDSNSLRAIGLETKSMWKEKYAHIENQVIQTLMEQERQWDCCGGDDDVDVKELAKVASLHSKQCRNEAAIVGTIVATQLRNDLLEEIRNLEKQLRRHSLGKSSKKLNRSLVFESQSKPSSNDMSLKKGKKHVRMIERRRFRSSPVNSPTRSLASQFLTRPPLSMSVTRL